jgi:hypothetical protein
VPFANLFTSLSMAGTVAGSGNPVSFGEFWTLGTTIPLVIGHCLHIPISIVGHG